MFTVEKPQVQKGFSYSFKSQSYIGSCLSNTIGHTFPITQALFPSISRELSLPVLWPEAWGASSQDVPWPLSWPTILAAQGLVPAGLSVLEAGELTVLEGKTIRGSFFPGIDVSCLVMKWTPQ